MMSLEESLKIDLKLENARMNRMGARFITVTESDENLDLELCKKCIHGDGRGKCVTKQESLFNSFVCLKNEQFEQGQCMLEVKLTVKQYAMVSECIERVSVNEREFDKGSEETLKEVAEKFKADYKELNKEKAE